MTAPPSPTLRRLADALEDVEPHLVLYVSVNGAGTPTALLNREYFLERFGQTDARTSGAHRHYEVTTPDGIEWSSCEPALSADETEWLEA